MYFPSIGKIEYKGANNDDPFSFSFYNASKVVGGKTMAEHLKFAMSYRNTIISDGTDAFGFGTIDKTFGGRAPMEIAQKRVEAAFELMEKLGIKYFCAYDRDLAPEGKTLDESNDYLDVVVPLVKELMERTGIKMLWCGANTFSNPRYMSGSGTSPNAGVYAYAAGQIKKAIDVSKELNSAGFLFWGGRDGYDTMLNANCIKEKENMAYLLHMSVDYARSIGYKGDFYIEPKPKEPTKHNYAYDTQTVLALLRRYGLEKDFKLNIEANHAVMAGHSFQHELRVARNNGVFGSIDANLSDATLGWETDRFPTNVYDATMCMYEVLCAGGFKNGGINFDTKTRRASNTSEDIFLSFIAGMDTYALGLLVAQRIIDEGVFDRMCSDRYSSFDSGVGKKITEHTTSLSELSDYALNHSEPTIASGRQEYMESLLNRYITLTAAENI